jgi:hypothetical protein
VKGPLNSELRRLTNKASQYSNFLYKFLFFEKIKKNKKINCESFKFSENNIISVEDSIEPSTFTSFVVF